MILPADQYRCVGVIDEGEWREGCDICLRRTDRPKGARFFLPFMDPPAIIAFECEGFIEPGFAPGINAGSKRQVDEMTTENPSENAGEAA